jgi:hypothetical protein
MYIMMMMMVFHIYKTLYNLKEVFTYSTVSLGLDKGSGKKVRAVLTLLESVFLCLSQHVSVNHTGRAIK